MHEGWELLKQLTCQIAPVVPSESSLLFTSGPNHVEVDRRATVVLHAFTATGLPSPCALGAFAVEGRTVVAS